MDIVKATPLQFEHLVSVARSPGAWLTLVVKGTFVLVPGGVCALALEQHPCGPAVHQDDAQEKSLRYDTDLAVRKPRGECFVLGTCHAPGGMPTGASGVAFRVGAVSKALAVFGDRHWVRRVLWTKLSEPTPFTAMPLRYERSFGGPGHPQNPHGVGASEVDTPQGRRRPAPNIEDPSGLMTAPTQRPAPAGSFPLPPSARGARPDADESWRAAQVPRFPPGFDFAYFNGAPPDQRCDGFWRGDEELALKNLHPRHEVLKSRLPGLRARCFVQPRGEGDLREVPMNLDTITVDADAGLVFCLWRGVADVASERLTDVARVFVLHDAPDAPRSLDDARRELAAALSSPGRASPEAAALRAREEAARRSAEGPAPPPLGPLAALAPLRQAAAQPAQQPAAWQPLGPLGPLNTPGAAPAAPALSPFGSPALPGAPPPSLGQQLASELRSRPEPGPAVAPEPAPPEPAEPSKPALIAAPPKPLMVLPGQGPPMLTPAAAEPRPAAKPAGEPSALPDVLAALPPELLETLARTSADPLSEVTFIPDARPASGAQTTPAMPAPTPAAEPPAAPEPPAEPSGEDNAFAEGPPTEYTFLTDSAAAQRTGLSDSSTVVDLVLDELQDLIAASTGGRGPKPPG